MKEHDIITAKEVNHMEISNMPDKELKVMVINILTGLEKRVQDLHEILNKDTENIKKNLPEMKNSITEIKNMVDGLSGRLEAAAEQISDRQDRAMGNNQAKKERQKKNNK